MVELFLQVEPFGKHLFEKLRTNPSEDYDGDPNIIANQNQNICIEAFI
jgi:hypothetical protein